jgi:hypothetical protein
MRRKSGWSRVLSALVFTLSMAVVPLLFSSSVAFGQAAATPAAATPPAKSPYEQATTGSKKIEGLWTLHTKDQQILAEITPGQLGQNFIVIVSISRGVSRGMVLGGMSWGFGDDVIWTFNKVGDKLHVVRRNVRFKAAPGSPEATAVKLAYSDSVLYSLPIVATGPSGGMLVDMTRVFLSDDQSIGRSLGGGFFFSPDRSTVSAAKAFKDNVEIGINAVYSGSVEFDQVADPKGVQVGVHYSISRLPTGGYTPRVADDRVGYFVTVLKDFSDNKDTEHFVRYVNRWNLKKKDPAAKLSPPEKPITFYMEKTVPVALRPTVRAGIEEWNKAYQKLGFDNAIEVIQQRDDDDWDPEDVRYNTFRWITADAGFAMGPSRVNPMTGEILDADIIFDAGFMQFWKQQYETFTPSDVAALAGQPLDSESEPLGKLLGGHTHLPGMSCRYCVGMQQQMNLAAAVFAARGIEGADGKPVPEEFIQQGLKEVVMHEVGHTLGLRHNFKASAWKTLAEINDPVKGAAEGTVASVMDYSPPNIAPKGQPQGLYYTQTIGPYDYWAIEYGYKPISGDEAAELKKIASRGTEPGLDYLTDEDTRGSVDADPLSNRFDLGKDPLEFARQQMKGTSELWPTVVKAAVKDGEGYQRARQAFSLLFMEYWRTQFFVSRIPGGIYTYRDHKGDPNARAPFVLVEAGKQRDAMKMLNESAFKLPDLPTDVMNFLAVTRWSHWGLREPNRLDYPIHDQIGMMQERVLSMVLSPQTLSRLHDATLKVAPEADLYTLEEHIKLVSSGLFTEILTEPEVKEYTGRKPFINSLRRNLQRMGVRELSHIVAHNHGDIPEDARSLARMHLSELDKQISVQLGKLPQMDDGSKAHLLDLQDRIKKVLEAKISSPALP